MASKTHPALGLSYDWNLGEPYKAEMDDNLVKLGFLVQSRVLSRTSAEPTSPSNGDCYIHNGGSWPVGSEGDILARLDDAWTVYQPQVGWSTYVEDEQVRLEYSAGGWSSTGVQSVDGEAGNVDLSGSYEAKRQDNLTATTDPGSSDDSGSGYGVLSRWINTDTGRLFICSDATAGAAVWAEVDAGDVDSVDGQTGDVDLSGSYESFRQNNLTATTDPGATDDADAGYEVLSRWLNTNTGQLFLCTDSAPGAAAWAVVTFTSADIQDDGTLALASPKVINCRNNLSVTDNGDGSVTIDSASGGTTVENNGAVIVSGATAINAGTGLEVSDDGDGTVTVSNTSSGGSPIILDLADDGTNESTDLAEIAVINDGSGVFTHPSQDKLVIDFARQIRNAAGSVSAKRIPRFQGTGGEVLEQSGVEIDPDDNLSGHGQSITSLTTDVTLSATEAGKTLHCSGGVRITAPENINTALPVGYTVTVVDEDGTGVTFSPGTTNVTIRSKNGNTSLAAEMSAATFYKAGTDTWFLIGDLA